MKIGREIKREGEKRIWRVRKKEEKNRGGKKGASLHLYSFFSFFLLNVITQYT